MNKTVLRWTKVVLLSPIVVVWDALYFVISKVYKGATWIDQKGGNVIDNFIEGDDIWQK